MTLSQCLSLHFLMSFQAEQPVSRPLRSRSNPEKAYVSSDEETSPFRMKSLHRKSHPPLEQRRYNRSPPPGHLPHHHPEHAAIHPDIHPDIHPAIHPIIHPVIHPPHLAPPEVQVSVVQISCNKLVITLIKKVCVPFWKQSCPVESNCFLSEWRWRVYSWRNRWHKQQQ